jgi:hypothetical protein
MQAVYTRKAHSAEGILNGIPAYRLYKLPVRNLRFSQQ